MGKRSTIRFACGVEAADAELAGVPAPVRTELKGRAAAAALAVWRKVRRGSRTGFMGTEIAR
jgi:hypothetical protein